jgi:orotate phosphoribosyltransferase
MDIEEIFKKIGVIREGHFLLTSGLHSGVYFEKFRLLEYPGYTGMVCERIANFFKGVEIDTVAGPTTGGIIVAYEVARMLKKRCIFAERIKKGRDFLRGFELKRGERILVVDDVLTTGGSVSDVINAVSRRGGVVIGIGVMIDRSEKPINFGVPLFSAFKARAQNFRESECPLCKKGIPLIRPGGVVSTQN